VTALEVSALRVELHPAGNEIVKEVAFSVARGEVVGLVGESGSGKTTVALALLGHAKRGTRIASGSVRIDGVEMLGRSAGEVRAARGSSISYVPQDPAAALNPALTIGTQLVEVIETHRRSASSVEALDRVRETLGEVTLPTDPAFLRRYPHQLSGGQQQRVCVAMAFLLRPKMIVLDEPTTGLDVTTQAHVLETVRELCREHNVGAVYVSHDLAAVSMLAQRVLVMYAGRVIEAGPVKRLFTRPGHPYTRGLVEAIPDISARLALEAIPGHVPPPGRRPDGCVFAPRCGHVLAGCREAEPPYVQLEPNHDVACFRAAEITATDLSLTIVPGAAVAPTEPVLVVRALSAFHGDQQVVNDASLELRPRECLALVGESGSGKTTLARAIMGLHVPRGGAIVFKGDVLSAEVRRRPAASRRGLQYIFQSPYNSLNPRHTIGEIVGVPIEHFFGLRGRATAERVQRALERVSLPASVAAAFPDELSGGERQRVAVARALACEPEVLICDEITSALDVSVQAAIIQLLEDLRREEGLAIIFVTHNLALVRTIADRVMVLNGGHVVESGITERVIGDPEHPYTRELIADTPTLAGLAIVAAAPPVSGA
jgi:oligopeptide/dipeptide ABC transporter ATP-binding protein